MIIFYDCGSTNKNLLYFENQGGFRQNVGNQNKNRPKNTIKFDSDYDFEQANNQFEELRSHMSKLKVGEDAKPEEVCNLCSVHLLARYFMCLLFV